MTAGQCGLALSYIMPMMSCVDGIVRNSAQLEVAMAKSERVLNYTKLEPEADLTSNNSPPESWPDKGYIEFKNVNFKYHDTAPKVLRDLDLSICGGSKVTYCLTAVINTIHKCNK